MVHFIFSPKYVSLYNPGESYLFLRDQKGLQSWAFESLFIMKYSKYYQPKMGWGRIIQQMDLVIFHGEH